MECNKDEAYRAKEIAEKKLIEKNTKEAKKLALKAQSLFPGIEGISQLVAAIDVHTASKKKINGETDWYSILAVQPQADDETIRKQYRKLALMLHPDKNKSLGADSAFKFVSQAWSLLSDKSKRASYDKKIRTFLPGSFHNASKSRKLHKGGKAADPSAPSSSRDAEASTFWTSCHRCKMQYEYMRVYINQNLLCPHCRESFLAFETLPPARKVLMKQTNGHSASSFGDTTYPYSNMRWSSFSNVDSPSRIVNAASVVQQAYAKAKRSRVEAQAASKRDEALKRKSFSKKLEIPKPSSKRRKPVGTKDSPSLENHKLLDYRTLCIRKAKISIKNMLKECSSTKPSRQNSEFPIQDHIELDSNSPSLKSIGADVEFSQLFPFDRHRIGECFKKNQVWAAYDMFDGMPRYYAIIDSVISLEPFEIQVCWLNPNFISLHSLHWVVSGFTQSCGEFRLGQTETCSTCTMFSHRVRRATNHHGSANIHPAKGDVWALYRNWSPMWSELTLDEVIMKYDVVEVAEDFDEQNGVIVVPLLKVAGFKTVFKQHVREIMRIDVKEIHRFSHQIPYHVLKGDEGLNGCKELDPAATPPDLQLIIDL